MQYDLGIVHQLCQELGLRSVMLAMDRLGIELNDGVVLVFQNAERDEDCLVGFDGTPWHAHDDFTFADGRGNYIEMGYLDLIAGLKDGEILICERFQQGKVKDRWLIHCGYNDEFKYMEEGEILTVSRASTVR